MVDYNVPCPRLGCDRRVDLGGVVAVSDELGDQGRRCSHNELCKVVFRAPSRSIPLLSPNPQTNKGFGHHATVGANQCQPGICDSSDENSGPVHG